MSNDDTQFAWWSRLRHSGLLLSPVVQIEKYAQEPEEPKWYQPDKLRTAHTRFVASIDRSKDRPQIAHSDILTWVDALLDKYIGHTDQRMARSHSIPESLTALVRIGSRTETLRPDRVVFDEDGKTPLLLVKADTSPHIGRGKGRTEYARFLELLRGSGHRLGLLTNGLQFRLVYAGLDFESWCEWESERWFEDAEGTGELLGLRQLLFPTQIKDKSGDVIGAGLPGLLHAIEESRKRQADLSAVLRENVRQAVEMILEDVSSASRTDPDLFCELMSPEHLEKPLAGTEAHEALLQATVRVVMRMVVCLFAESRGLLPTGDLIYSQAYGVRSLYELLDETVRHEGSQMGLMTRQSAWPRLMALFRLIHGGSTHGGFPLRPYGGVLFRPGEAEDSDPVARALHILEHKVSVNDATIFRVLRKLLRGPLPVMRGRSKTYVEGPVDYTELRTEFIGLIYEGLLDYRLKRTDEETGPQVFLNLGRQPVLPLSRLQQMLEDNPKSIKDLFSTLKKEKVSATARSEDEDEAADEADLDSDEPAEDEQEPVLGKDANDLQDQIHLDAAQAARRWAAKAITETKLIGKQKKRETDTEYQKRIEEAVEDLIDRVVAPGEFYLVRAGNTRKGTGTFYTRPQLAVPTVHRTLEPLCYERVDGGGCVVDGQKEITDGSAELSGSGSLAGGDEAGHDGVSRDEGLSQRGNLRSDQSTPSGGRVGSVEHRRRSGEAIDEGVSEPPVDGEGLTAGSSDPDRDRTPAELSQDGVEPSSTAASSVGQSSPQRTDPLPRSKTQAEVTTHHPPSTTHLVPKKPEEILALKVCDPACGSASFLVAALHYLTDALYKSLCHHCGLDDPKRVGKITLPFGTPRDTPSTTHQPPTTDLVPLPPDDPNRGEEFTERVQALLRRHVVERCIYGVDINPLAVEFARVSLWVETLDPELPFSFLDHKIKVGNSLVGCWLNRVQDYPIMAWSRLQRQCDQKGDLKQYSKAIKAKRDGQIKPLVREWIDDQGPQHQLGFAKPDETVESVHRDIADALEELHSMPMSADGIGQREAAYERRVLSDERRQRLKTALDAWCSIWFWPPNRLELCPLPADIGTDLSHKPDMLAEVERVAAEHRFFHWELEFPDVLNGVGSGFDIIVGNPPWETSKPISMEFFTEFDPIYRTYGNQDAKREQKKLFEQNRSIAELWRRYVAKFGAMSNWVSHAANPAGYYPRQQDGPSAFNLMEKGAQWRQSDQYHADWKTMRAGRTGFVSVQYPPFHLQGAADINLYKLFAELMWLLTKDGGRVGLILPSGFYSDLGSESLRRTFLLNGSVDLIYAFQNEKRVFSEAHHAMKQAVVIGAKGETTRSLLTRFRMGVGDSPNASEIPYDLLEGDKHAIRLTTEDVARMSPASFGLLEMRTQTDLEVFRNLSHASEAIQDHSTFKLHYTNELHLTGDSRHFSPIDKWIGSGFHEDKYGFWRDENGLGAIPLFEGRMIGQFDFSRKGWVSGKGRSAVWQTLPFDQKKIEPQYLMDLDVWRSWDKAIHGDKIALMDVTASTNTRTVIASPTWYFPFGHSAPVLSADGDLWHVLVVAGLLNSFVFDFIARLRVSGIHLTLFIIQECRLPKLNEVSTNLAALHIAVNVARLSYLHCVFAPQWLWLQDRCEVLSYKEWKFWWAVTEADRLRLIAEINALSAELYALDIESFEWIIRNDPTDSKGFYRVDNHLPFRERTTAVSAMAFRTLKEGKWAPAETWQLSNDEFFYLLGIPELTNAEASKAKGLSGPLVLKREGCHSWHPENFPEDDPRHGWTWDDCWKDAKTILGSEDAVREYLASDSNESEDVHYTGPRDLFGHPIIEKPKQRKLF